MDSLGLFAVLMFFGFIATEGCVEYFLGTLFEKVPKLTPLSWVLMYVSLGVGVFLAYAFQLDAVAKVFSITSPTMPWLGTGLTGVVIGRGANFVADVWKKYLTK